MACYVFRINYNEHYKTIRSELLNNKLRQGWGAGGMGVDQDFKSFKVAWRSNWGKKDGSDSLIEKRYRNIKIMTEIKQGDYIIIPKISTKDDFVCKSFVVAKCKNGYKFKTLEKINDFGHYIEVEILFSCRYDMNIDSQTISSKFRAYQSPLNRVLNEDFEHAVDNLVKKHDETPDVFEKESSDLMTMIDIETREHREKYLKYTVEALRNLNNHKFEDIIAELFEKNGYLVVGKNRYDGDGGDVDIIFEAYNRNTLMHNIYEICELESPRIHVQAKKKKGIDLDDIDGVKQLIKMRDDEDIEKNSIYILISLVDYFTEDTKIEADNNGIILINGITFASLLVRYGIEVEISR